MKKVLIVQPTLGPYRVDFFNRLNLIYDLRICFIYNYYQKNKFLNDIQSSIRSQLNCKWIQLNNFRIFKRAFPIGIDKIIYDFKPDVVIGSEFSLINNYILFIKKLKRLKFKQLTITDDNEFIVMSDSMSLRYLNKLFLFKFLDGIIIIDNPLVKNFYYKLISQSKVLPIIHLLQDENRIWNLIKNGRIIRMKTNKRIILFVGRLESSKGLFEVLPTLTKLIKEDSCVNFYIVGEGTERTKIECFIKNNRLETSIFLFGQVTGENLINYYLNSNVFLLPSKFEPFGAVINEALICGLPAICSDKVGAKILINNNVNGSIFKLGDNEDLERQLKYWLYKDLKNKKESLMPVTFEEQVRKFTEFLS